MGDRANIYVVDRRPAAADDTETTGIYLYTHWNGSNWPELLREALRSDAARRRWSDEPYLLRIISDQLFKDIRDSETGGGISTMIGDNEYPITILDMVNRTVSWAPEGSETDRNAWRNTIGYGDFVNLAHAGYPAEVARR